MTAVAVVGVGRMGRPMSLHLRDAGFDVAGYDVSPEAGRWARERGLRTAGSAKDAVTGADIVLIVTGDESQVRSASHGPDGILAGGHTGQILMLVTTVPPGFAQAFASQASERGVHVLDAPVCRGERCAVEANLLWMVGGRRQDLESCRGVMEACGPAIHLLGPHGSGQVGKAANNMLLWAAVCADHEALALADRHDVDTTALRAALTESSAANWALANWDEMNSIPWAGKDMDIFLAMADGVDLSASVAALTRTLVRQHLSRTGWT